MLNTGSTVARQGTGPAFLMLQKLKDRNSSPALKTLGPALPPAIDGEGYGRGSSPLPHICMDVLFIVLSLRVDASAMVTS